MSQEDSSPTNGAVRIRVVDSFRAMDSVTLMESIRAKVAARTVQSVYDSQPMLFYSGRTAYACQGCDAVFMGEVSIGYRADSGEAHWFHLTCDAIRKRVSLVPAGPQFASPANAPRWWAGR